LIETTNTVSVDTEHRVTVVCMYTGWWSSVVADAGNAAPSWQDNLRWAHYQWLGHCACTDWWQSSNILTLL